MHLWTITNWEQVYKDISVRKGIRLRCDADVSEEVRNECKVFFKWLRREFDFPVRVPVYLKSTMKLKTMDDDWAYGTFFAPDDRINEPYIRIAVGDYETLKHKWDRDSALCTIVTCISHELTHYFQWINAIELTSRGMERQATMYSRYIIDEFSEVRDELLLSAQQNTKIRR